MKNFVITATTKNGHKWETRRGTSKGMNAVVQEILKDKDIVKFAVEKR